MVGTKKAGRRAHLCQQLHGCDPSELSALLKFTNHTMETLGIVERLYADDFAWLNYSRLLSGTLRLAAMTSTSAADVNRAEKRPNFLTPRRSTQQVPESSLAVTRSTVNVVNQVPRGRHTAKLDGILRANCEKLRSNSSRCRTLYSAEPLIHRNIILGV